MADITRGHTFNDGDRLTPDNLNALVNSSQVKNIASTELGSGLVLPVWGASAPSLIGGRMWFDTTSGQEGLKYAFVSPSNASISGYCYATPRREAYFWAATTVSMGAPLFLGAPRQFTDSRGYIEYDGVLLPIAAPAHAADPFSITPALVVATESGGPGPIRCAWSGLIPALIFGSGASLGSTLSIDHSAPYRWAVDHPDLAFGSFFKDLVAWWTFSGSSGVTRADSWGTYHAAPGDPLPSGDGLAVTDDHSIFSTEADVLGLSVSAPSLPDFDFDDGRDFTIGAWVRPASALAALNRQIIQRWTYGTNKSWVLQAAISPSRFNFFVKRASDGSNISVAVNTFVSGTWHCVFCGYDSNADEIWIEVDAGNRVATSLGGGGISTGAGTHVMLAGIWHGDIDEIAVWRRTLSREEREDFFNRRKGITLDRTNLRAQLVAGWHFNRTALIPDELGNGFDLAPTLNQLTLTSGVLSPGEALILDSEANQGSYEVAASGRLLFGDGQPHTVAYLLRVSSDPGSNLTPFAHVPTTNYALDLVRNAGAFYPKLNWYGTDIASSSASISIGSWEVLFTYYDRDRGVAGVQLRDEQSSIVEQSAAGASNPTALRFGHSCAGVVEIDSAYIWRRALSASERATVYRTLIASGSLVNRGRQSTYGTLVGDHAYLLWGSGPVNFDIDP